MRTPKAEPVWEAMAPELNPRGTPYVCGDKTFPPGEWIEVTAGMAQRIELYGWGQTREKAD